MCDEKQGRVVPNTILAFEKKIDKEGRMDSTHAQLADEVGGCWLLSIPWRFIWRIWDSLNS